MTDGTKTSYNAILIGINTVDSADGPGLKGCVPDVQEISKELDKSVIPGPLIIHSFTATPGPESGKPIEPRQQWPTYDNINSCLSTITRSSGQGDQVYIHFSGHSTVVPPKETWTYSNWDTGDLALVVLDGPCATDECYFHGSELAVHLNNMVNKGIGVTIVLDCCFSGSTLRKSDEVVRYVPYRPELDKRPPQTAKPAHSTISTLRGDRQTFMVPTWLANPDRYAILTSSDATEKAYGLKLGDGSRHGTLTYFLLEVFDGLGGVGGNMHQLAESIRIRITDHRRKHFTRTQSPVLFGNKTQFFFGLPRPSFSADIPITLIADNTTGHRVRLHAGAAHGIAKGDKFGLHPLSSARDPISTLAEVITVRGVTSDLEVIGIGSEMVQTGWLATRLTRLSLRQFPIKLLVQQKSLTQWKEAIQDRVSLAEYDETAHKTLILPTGTCSFTVVQTGSATYQIHDEQKKDTIATLSIPEGCDRAIQQILNHIHHLASFKLVLNLSNLDTDTTAQNFKQSYSIVMTHEREGISYNPGCGKTDNHSEVCLHPECQIILTPKDKVRLVVKNLGERDDPRLFLHLYTLGSGWEVEDMTRSSREVIPPAGTVLGDAGDGEGSKCSGVFRRKFKFSLEEGEAACEDVVKVFLTRQPTLFATLELPRLGERGAGYSEVDLGGSTRASSSSSVRDSEDWAALTFRIRVVRGED